jgi:ABC-type phosphate/phosphonate transport system substrate-binding protein
VKSLKTIFACAFLLLASGRAAYADLNIGVLAPRGELKATTRWAEFGKYLTAQLKQEVHIVPLAPTKVIDAVKNGQIDVLLSNPAHALTVAERYGAKHPATLSDKEGPQFAGLIITRRDGGLKRVSDLKGKTVMTLEDSASGAYIFQAYHLRKHGLDVNRDMKRITGKNQDDLVLAVKGGFADAAFIRTGVLEAMARDGKIGKDDLDVLEPRKDKDFDYPHTTALYPEWYLSVLPKVNGATAAKLKTAVLNLKPEDPACASAKINGFVPPLPLAGMKDALKTLKLPPYNGK